MSYIPHPLFPTFLKFPVHALTLKASQLLANSQIAQCMYDPFRLSESFFFLCNTQRIPYHRCLYLKYVFKEATHHEDQTIKYMKAAKLMNFRYSTWMVLRNAHCPRTMLNICFDPYSFFCLSPSCYKNSPPCPPFSTYLLSAAAKYKFFAKQRTPSVYLFPAK